MVAHVVLNGEEITHEIAPNAIVRTLMRKVLEQHGFAPDRWMDWEIRAADGELFRDERRIRTVMSGYWYMNLRAGVAA